AGVGENSPEVRAAACSTLEFLDLKLDRELNARPFIDCDISTADSRVRVLVFGRKRTGPSQPSVGNSRALPNQSVQPVEPVACGVGIRHESIRNCEYTVSKKEQKQT